MLPAFYAERLNFGASSPSKENIVSITEFGHRLAIEAKRSLHDGLNEFTIDAGPFTKIQVKVSPQLAVGACGFQVNWDGRPLVIGASAWKWPAAQPAFEALEQVYLKHTDSRPGDWAAIRPPSEVPWTGDFTLGSVHFMGFKSIDQVLEATEYLAEMPVALASGIFAFQRELGQSPQK